MKSNIGLREAIEFIGITAVVVSLAFVIYELRLSRSIARSEGFNQINELNQGLSEMIASHPDVWHRGCLGEELTPEESIIFSKLAQARVVHGFTQWGRAQAGISTNIPEAIAYSLALNIYLFPGLV